LSIQLTFEECEKCNLFNAIALIHCCFHTSALYQQNGDPSSNVQSEYLSTSTEQDSAMLHDTSCCCLLRM